MDPQQFQHELNRMGMQQQQNQMAQQMMGQQQQACGLYFAFCSFARVKNSDTAIFFNLLFPSP